ATARGEQSAELLDLRMACLDDRLAELRAKAELFARADAQVVEKAVSAAGALGGLEACADARALRQRTPLPSAERRTKVQAVRAQLAAARALLDAGKFADGLARARPIAAE